MEIQKKLWKVWKKEQMTVYFSYFPVIIGSLNIKSDSSLYYIYFEITVNLCNLIGSEQCD